MSAPFPSSSRIYTNTHQVYLEALCARVEQIEARLSDLTSQIYTLELSQRELNSHMQALQSCVGTTLVATTVRCIPDESSGTLTTVSQGQDMRVWYPLYTHENGSVWAKTNYVHPDDLTTLVGGWVMIKDSIGQLTLGNFRTM